MTCRVRTSFAAPWMRGSSAALVLSLILLLPAMALSSSGTEGMPGSSPGTNPGMRMYREGILPSGEKMRGETSGGVLFSGAKAACANCHRRSGMGSAEGGTGVRPVTGAALYRPEEVWGVGPGRKAPRGSQNRPVYTDETLARAIRDGVNPAGRRFDPAMPRYTLKDADLALLIAYLKSLSATSAPGVTENVIRFATVVDTRVSPDRRNAMLDVLRIYTRDKNAGARNEALRARAAPWTDARRFRAYRTWELDAVGTFRPRRDLGGTTRGVLSPSARLRPDRGDLRRGVGTGPPVLRTARGPVPLPQCGCPCSLRSGVLHRLLFPGRAARSRSPRPAPGRRTGRYPSRAGRPGIQGRRDRAGRGGGVPGGGDALRSVGTPRNSPTGGRGSAGPDPRGDAGKHTPGDGCPVAVRTRSAPSRDPTRGQSLSREGVPLLHACRHGGGRGAGRAEGGCLSCPPLRSSEEGRGSEAGSGYG